jgi:holo-[acyl-carrier protein] synthase
MAVYGIGVDLVEVDRIKQVMEKFGNRFKEKIFSTAEQKFCEGRSNKYLSYAARFAAKEAFSKALGTGLRGIISWRDVIVNDNEKSRPELDVTGRAKAILNTRKTFLSITHTEKYASAIVVIEE